MSVAKTRRGSEGTNEAGDGEEKRRGIKAKRTEFREEV